MALLLKRTYQGYMTAMNELSDPRAEDFYLMSSPLPLMGILAIWCMFIFKWGPEYMKDKEPLNLKPIMMVYNIAQVMVNLYVLLYAWLGRDVISWKCSEVDYSRSYWGIKMLTLCYIYFLLKIADLLDTIFFVLRKKSGHMSFLHIYHHFGMTWVGWIGVKFIGGGHSYFVGLANCIVHSILYSYYLLTAYDSRYSKLLWLKKFITQAQLFQFVFLFFTYVHLLFQKDCNYPKFAIYVFVPQNTFMIILFSDFYIRTYYLAPRRKRKELEEKKRLQEMEKNGKNL